MCVKIAHKTTSDCNCIVKLQPLEVDKSGKGYLCYFVQSLQTTQEMSRLFFLQPRKRYHLKETD